jgi:hypothetical protein
MGGRSLAGIIRVFILLVCQTLPRQSQLLFEDPMSISRPGGIHKPIVPICA